MNCAFCKLEIEDDSLYCDQCGKEIFICPKCGKPGKGKVCIYDGTNLDSMKVKLGSGIDQSSIQSDKTEPSQEIPSTPEPGIEQKVKIPELSLVNRTLNLFLKIEPGDILGRNSGRFTDLFRQYRWVSGKHLKFEYDPEKGWAVSDLNSKNGAKYKNTKLIPFQPVTLKDNTFLLMGKIEFFVQISDLKQKIRTETIKIN